jgi:hypothetical protein
MQSYRIFDVVYMVIEEVKTVLDKNTMTEAINNIASVKQLIFIPTSNASTDSSKQTLDGKGPFWKLEKTRSLLWPSFLVIRLILELSTLCLLGNVHARIS